MRGCRFLQARLRVHRGAEPGRVGEQRFDEPEHEGAGDVESLVEVDGADERLHRVSEDRRLLAAAGEFLAAAEPQVRSRARWMRAISASATVDTTLARILASEPSGRSGFSR